MAFAISQRTHYFLLRDHLLELFHGHLTDVPLFSFANGDLPLFKRFVAEYKHLRYLLHLRVPYLGSDLVAARICLNPEACALKFVRDLDGVIVDAVRYREDCHLHRSEPQRECTRIMFDQYSEEPFDRSKKRTMDHIRTMLLVVLARVFQFETLRQIEVQLDRSQLPDTADRILDLDVYLRAVKCGFAFDPFVLDLTFFEGSGQRFLCTDPIFIGTEITFVLGR